jgi:hypothetical protein
VTATLATPSPESVLCRGREWVERQLHQVPTYVLSPFDPRLLQSLGDLALYALCLPLRTGTEPTNPAVQLLQQLVTPILDAPEWDDLVMLNPGLALELIAIARFGRGRAARAGALAAIYHQLMAQGRLWQGEWVPHYALGLALGLAELEVHWRGTPAPALWAETLFARMAPLWQWTLNDLKAFLRLGAILASGRQEGMALLSQDQRAYLARTSVDVAMLSCVEDRPGLAAGALFLAGVLEAPPRRDLSAVLRYLQGAQRPDGALYETRRAEVDSRNPVDRFLLGIVPTGLLALTGDLLPSTVIDGRKGGEPA